MIFVDLLVKALLAFGSKLLISLCSEKMVEWAFFKIADSVVKSTKTTQDDEWLDKIRDVYFGEDNGSND